MFAPEEYPHMPELLDRIKRDMEFLIFLKDRGVLTEYHDDYIHVYETLADIYCMCNVN